MRIRTLPVLTNIVLASAAGAALALRPSDCTVTSVGKTPIMDLAGYYGSKEGGLYPGGTNQIPPAHLAAGFQQIAQIVPRDAAGAPAANGKIGLLTIGMSNTNIESNAFISIASASPSKKPSVVVINGAQGGQDAATTSNPGAAYWTYVDGRVQAAGLTNQQIQTVWLKQAVAGVSLPFSQDSDLLKGYLQSIVQILHNKFPNLRACYLSSRIYAGYATSTLNPEPYAYQSGFAIKDLITAQINGDPALNYDIAQGPVAAPWLAWGPYLWADGLVPRSDGLTWVCADLNNDGTHPSSSGASKVANMLMTFFLNDSTAAPWFAEPKPQCNISAAVSFFGSGLAGSFGVPVITSTPPALGSPNPFSVMGGNAPPGGIVYFVFGNAAYPDGVVSFAGGWQHVSAELIVPALAAANGIATLSFGPLPESIELCGYQFYGQIATEDSGAPQGFGLSRGAHWRLGN